MRAMAAVLCLGCKNSHGKCIMHDEFVLLLNCFAVPAEVHIVILRICNPQAHT